MSETEGDKRRPGTVLRVLRKIAVRRYRRDESGATAVEFALISVPFMMLMMGITELALMLWTSQEMEEALFQSSRVMLTGESLAKYANPATAAQDFRNDVCAKLKLTVNCSSRLQVDVRTYTSFANAQSTTPITAGALDTSGFGYQPVGPNTIVVIRAVMSYPITLSTWNKAFANLADGSRALMASIAFRTEPFPAP